MRTPVFQKELYTSPFQKWEKAALVLKANMIASKLRPSDRPKELFAAILDASLNLGENSWKKNILDGVSLQHINFDDATENLSLGFSNGQTTNIDSFLILQVFPKCLCFVLIASFTVHGC